MKKITARYIKWTEEDSKKVVDLIKKDYDISEIEATLLIPRQRIRIIAKKHNLKIHKVKSYKKKERLNRLYPFKHPTRQFDIDLLTQIIIENGFQNFLDSISLMVDIPKNHLLNMTIASLHKCISLSDNRKHALFEDVDYDFPIRK